MYFDDYYFDFEMVLGGLKFVYIKYIGNGLVFVEVSIISLQIFVDCWGDKSLKCCIIDFNNKMVCDIKEILVYNGDGGWCFVVLVDGGYVYCLVIVLEGIYIYQVDFQVVIVVRGVKVLIMFVGGFFCLD